MMEDIQLGMADMALTTPAASMTKTRAKNKPIWYNVMRDDEYFQLLIGKFGDDVVSVPHSYVYPSRGVTNINTDNDEDTEDAMIVVEPFRKVSSTLPFALRFQLELSLFSGDPIAIQQVRKPRDDGTFEEDRKEEIARAARRLVITFIEQVVPPLLGIDWTLDVDNFALSELFSEVIGTKLSTICQCVYDVKPFTFGQRDVEDAMHKARKWLESAVRRCGTEQDLAVGDITDIELIKRRAKFPYAEYSSKFFVGGDLIPTEYEIVECRSFSSEPYSRRGLREGGWLVRDRFCRVGNNFDVGGCLAKWVRDEPFFCGRKYNFLFDKGVGSDMKVWLYSEHTLGMSSGQPDLEITRDSFLSSLGNLENIAPSKVGDRIGLAFSQTVPTVRLAGDQVVTMPEIVNNGYAFSDGCGVMGTDVARAIQETMGQTKLPGAVQIRIGGVKGMLSLVHNSQFAADSIGIRPSQIKFQSSHRILEVKSVAECNVRAGNYKIFKEALLVMDHLGVMCDTFYQLQERTFFEMFMALDMPFENGNEVLDRAEYLSSVLNGGPKLNGETFTTSEYEEIKASIVAAKEKININLGCSVMFGIIDEYNQLEEGQVLVCNGGIIGDVLVTRAPCMFPGDIQKAKAVGANGDKRYKCFDQVIVFSAKGERPLADKLGGGDLDGDRFHIVYEADVVNMVIPSEPHDFGTQQAYVQESIDISKAFCDQTELSFLAPNMLKQLQVLEEFMGNSNLVSNTADAWLRIADKRGVADENAQRLAGLHQRALDSRKANHTIDRANLEYMEHVLEVVPPPHYRRGSSRGEKHSSFLDLLFGFWQYNINKVNILIGRKKLHPSQDEASASLDQDERRNEQLKISAIKITKVRDAKKESKWKECAYCGVFKKHEEMKRCAVCNARYVCIGTCEVNHWRLCFGLQWRESNAFLDDDSDDESSIATISTLGMSVIGSKERSRDNTADTLSLTSYEYDESDDMFSVEEGKDTVDFLIDVVFGNTKRPTCMGAKSIDWRYLDAERDLPTLVKLVLVEFYAGFKRELSEAKRRVRDKTHYVPHILDVFLMSPRLNRGNIDLAVCVRSDKARARLVWRDGLGTQYPIETEPFHLFRVASLSGTCRILESLYTTPLPGTLLELALKRSADAVINPKSVPLLNSKIQSIQLNSSQKQAVATLQTFKEGFFLVHGPPGTGKTLTLAAMIAQIGGGIILAPSNAAVANVALKVLTLKQFDCKDIVVFGENCHESIQFLSPIHRSRYFATFREKYWKQCSKKIDLDVFLSDFSTWLRLDKGKLIRVKVDRKDSYSPVQRRLLIGFASWLRVNNVTSQGDKVTFEDLEVRCSKVNSDNVKGQQLLHKIISGAKVVLCTLNTAGSHVLRKSSKFETLFLDEAAQCPDAEFYIATTFPGIKRIVTIGDPRQLNATVLDRDCQEMGYGVSWMQHTMEVLGSSKVHMLDTQYRCDEAILDFSNKHFYGGRIRTDASISQRKPKVNYPILFVNTHELESGEEKEGASYKNHFESRSVLILLKEDPDIKRLQSSKPTVMIITPYKSQAALIKLELATENLLTSYVKVDTVDAFQGQEADIVIASLVRTRKAGFTDDPKRINVMLTRAKRIVRIVGDLEFWSNPGSSDSTLNSLVEYCMERDIVTNDKRLKSTGRKKLRARLKPTWSLIKNCIWAVNMTAKFHFCLSSMKSINKNLAFNTLLKVALPSTSDLHLMPNPDKPVWQISAIKGYEDNVHIVWCAKEGDEKPIIEAHFAGLKKECFHFIQTHPALPKGSVGVKRDLTGPSIIEGTGDTLVQSKNIELAWTLTKSMGDAMVDSVIDELPEGCFDLDPSQKEILRAPLPLMIESGSGTGKTNVLFQHAVSNAQQTRDTNDENKCACFVTVSPTLRKELAQRYNSVERMEKIALPPIIFYSLRELLKGLVTFSKLDIQESCTFLQYVHYQEAATYTSFGVDSKEAENEIGGVIMGSLDSAKLGRPLSREEYVNTKRSYIKTNSSAGKQKRHDIYDEYEKYSRWKVAPSPYKFDLNDIVLRLINKFRGTHSKTGDEGRQMGGWVELYSSCYLDEIQDFSYAAIYLILNIAGCSDQRWVFAGDTAQMISPGCSFAFKGLKEVLLEVQPALSFNQIKHVSKLGKNYRVTRDVLNVSNSILNRAKQCFQNDIQYIRPEVAMNDLGTRVRVCSWDEALKHGHPRFAPNQALVYSSTNDQVEKQMNQWLNDHPFILTSLECKGLEFDDCVVAFDVERKAWDIKDGNVASLRLLRELYVAVTRAKRRVVILYKTGQIKDFFMSLQSQGCTIEESDAEVALLEFDSGTTKDAWFKRGMELFEDEQYKMAASCFKAADNFGYFEYSNGMLAMQNLLNETAKESFRRSANRFFGKADYEHALDSLKLIIEYPPWNPEDDYIYDVSMRNCPGYFPRNKTIQFALTRCKWNEISIDDLTDRSSAHLFCDFRNNAELKEIISTCSKQDFEGIKDTLPLFAADYFYGRGDYFMATTHYLSPALDAEMAEKATNTMIANKSPALGEIAKYWRRSGAEEASKALSTDGDTYLLLQLYDDPLNVARSRSTEALRKFGQNVIESAFDYSKTELEELHCFSQDRFQTKVDQALRTKYRGNLIEAVQWYIHRKDEKRAEDFADNIIEVWTNDNLLSIARKKLNPTRLIDEAEKRGILIKLVDVRLGCAVPNLTQAVNASDRALSSIEKAEANHEKLIEVWDKYKNDKRVKKLLERKQSKPPGPNIVVFLNLYWHPQRSSTQLSKFCMSLFGAKVVHNAVSTAFGDVREKFRILSAFDDKAFEHLRPAPAKKPKQDSESTKFKPGDHVVLQGLKNRSFNGQRGTILSWLKREERYGVQLDGKKKPISFKPQNIRIDNSNQSDDVSISDNKPKGKQLSDIKPAQRQPRARAQFDSSSSDDSDSDEPPPLNDRAQSSSDESSSSSDSAPPLLSRGNQSNSSDSSDDSDASSIPALRKKDSSSSDEEDMIPALSGYNQQSSSSSDESDYGAQRRAQRVRQGRQRKKGAGRVRRT